MKVHHARGLLQGSLLVFAQGGGLITSPPTRFEPKITDTGKDELKDHRLKLIFTYLEPII